MPSDLFDVYIDLVLLDSNEVVNLIPTSVHPGALISGTNPYDAATIVIHGASISGIEEFEVEASLGPSGAFPGMFDDGAINTETFFSTAATLPTVFDLASEYTTSSVDDAYIVTAMSFLTSFVLTWFIDIDVGLYYSNYIVGLNDTATKFKIYRGKVRTADDLAVDLFLHNDRKFTVNFDLYSVLQGTINLFAADVEAESGRIAQVLSDVYCVSTIVSGINTDLFCTSQNNVVRLDVDLEATAGRTDTLITDCFSSEPVSSTAINCDIRVWSLEASGFFLEVGEHTSVLDTAWVDIVDTLKGVSTSGTYFKVDGVPVSVTFSGITNGYRMFYNPPDDFATDGTLIYTAHIRNLAGDEKDVNYYLLRGYSLTHNDVIDWGPGKKVDIWMTATNSGFCPETSTDGFYFVTRELRQSAIGATINAIGYVGLDASIYPQSNSFFYGSTYTVTISGVKDLAGNEMDPFIHTFTIEDPPT